MNKKKLIAKMSELIETHNSLQRELDCVKRENSELKTLVKTLTEQLEQTKKSKKEEKAVTEPTETVSFEPKAEVPVSCEPKETVILADTVMEYGSVAIGKIVQESIKYSGIVSSSDNKKELLNLIMGKGEIAKNEIYTITRCDSSEETKRELIDAQLNETLDYFKSIAGQI